MGNWVLLELVRWVVLALVIGMLFVVVVMFVSFMCDIVRGSTVTWKGRKIENPVAKILLIVLGNIVGLLLDLLWVVLSPLWIPAHLILRAYGRKGLFTTEANPYKLTLNREAFSRVEEL